MRWTHGVPVLVLALTLAPAPAAPAEEVKAPAKPTPNLPDEPLAKAVSLAKAASFLDGVALAWTRERNCGTCHTNYAYLLARPSLKDLPGPAHQEIRAFFEKRAANWDSGKKEDKPRWDTEVVATAGTLALHDAMTTGKLSPVTRQALDKMWTLQDKQGAWNWLKCEWPPLEHDDYYGAVFAALAVGHAPDQYARSPSAQAGLTKLRGYLASHKAPDLHHKALLLWASTKLDGLMDEAEKLTTIKELSNLQRDDGGWALPSLGDYKRKDGRPNDKQAASDGYGTGFVVYVLRQAGVPASDPRVQKGAAWLRQNQRESGRWFTRSLNNDKFHYIANAGTAYAVMALRACQPE